jgi:hypothetical protein
MRYTRTFLPLGAAALLISFVLPTVAYCQDKPTSSASATLLSRLRGVAFVGVTYDERNTSMALHAMTEEQQVAYVEARDKATQFNRERDAKRRAARTKLNEARARKAPSEEIVRLQRELDQNSDYVERSTFASFGNDVHRVVGVGADFLEIEYLHRPNMTEIIPLSEIRRVIFRSDLPMFELKSDETPPAESEGK